MCRIPSWMQDAIPLALVAAALGLVASGCFNEQDRAGAPALLVSPSEAKQGDWLAITLSAEGVEFSQCADLTVESLEFVFKTGENLTGENLIKVHSVDMLSSTQIRAYVDIDQDAAAGAYIVRLYCDLLTTFEGDFNVKQSSEDLPLTLLPPSLAAGSQEQTLSLIGTKKFFDEETSYVIFGDGTQVVVLEQAEGDESTDGSYVLEVTVNVSPSAPEKEIDVVVVMGTSVARGKLLITGYVEPSISLEDPKEVERPAADEGQPRQYTLKIKGEGVNFVPAENDAGAEDPLATQVSFPYGENNLDSPGIVVTRVNVLNQKELETNISVYDFAYIGVTRLRVTTGDHNPETTLTVTAAEDDPTLDLFPRTVTRGSKNRGVLAKAHNFEFASSTTIKCLDAGCMVKSYPPDVPSKQMVLSVSIDAGFSANSATVEVVSGAITVRESLIIVDPEGLVLEPIDGVALVQGSTGNEMALELRLGEFDAQATASVLTRSGLKIVSQSMNEARTIISLVIDVDEDAPTGPALIRIVSGADVLEALTNISPSENVPWFSVQPDWIAQGRRTVMMDLEAAGFKFSKSDTIFNYDDPAIQTHNLAVDDVDAGLARLEIDVSPLARSDIITIYVRTAENQAAATFHVLKIETPIITSISPTEVARGNTEMISVRVEGMEFGATVAEVMDNIGVEVHDVRVDPLDNHNAEFEMVVDDQGPGGWIGVLLMSDWQNVVVPIFIDAGDSEPLTMQISPDSISVGSRPAEMSITLPTQALLTGSSEIHTGILGAYPTLPDIENPSNATFSLDVRFDVEADGSGVPLFATTSKGAAVGFAALDALEFHDLKENAPWQEVMTDGSEVLVDVAPGQTPSVLFSSEGREGFAEMAFELLSSNALDTAAASAGNFIWITDESEARLLVSTPSDPAGAPYEIRVKSIGAGADLLVEEGGKSPDDDAEWEIEDDPCEQPILLAGAIDGALDADTVWVQETSCKLEIAVLARALADRPWSTPDLKLRLEASDGSTLAESTGWPAPDNADPLIVTDSNLADATLIIDSENASAGSYLVNIRRPFLISEIGRSPFLEYIEINVEEGVSLSQLTMELVDSETGLVLDSFSFLNQTVENDGTVVIGATESPEFDIMDPIAVMPDEGAFAVRLLWNGQLVDAVQVGDGQYDFGEGEPIPDKDGVSVFTRILGLDTNNNKGDFIGRWVGDPGR